MNELFIKIRKLLLLRRLEKLCPTGSIDFRNYYKILKAVEPLKHLSEHNELHQYLIARGYPSSVLPGQIRLAKDESSKSTKELGVLIFYLENLVHIDDRLYFKNYIPNAFYGYLSDDNYKLLADSPLVQDYHYPKNL